MSELEQQDDQRIGTSVVHRRYVSRREGHFPGGVVDGAYTLGIFGDAGTEMCIRLDGDEGLLVGFADVDFLEPVHTGDVLEVEATLLRVGTTSRDIAFEARVVCRSAEHLESRRPPRDGSARVLDEPLIVLRATGTVVVA